MYHLKVVCIFDAGCLSFYQVGGINSLWINHRVEDPLKGNHLWFVVQDPSWPTNLFLRITLFFTEFLFFYFYHLWLFLGILCRLMFFIAIWFVIFFLFSFSRREVILFQRFTKHLRIGLAVRKMMIQLLIVIDLWFYHRYVFFCSEDSFHSSIIDYLWSI